MTFPAGEGGVEVLERCPVLDLRSQPDLCFALDRVTQVELAGPGAPLGSGDS